MNLYSSFFLQKTNDLGPKTAFRSAMYANTFSHEMPFLVASLSVFVTKERAI